MAVLTQIEDFIGRRNVAGSEKLSVQELLQEFIDTFEPDYIKKLLGVELSELFTAGISEAIPDTKWTTLKTKIKDKAINFIYFYWLRENSSFQTAQGEAQPTAENVMMVTSVMRQVRFLNEIITWIEDDFSEWMEQNGTDYPEYDDTYYSWKPINEFGI